MFCEYPSEVLEAIAYAVYLAAEPPLQTSLDPVFTPEIPTPAPTSLPSSWPPPSWTEERSRTTLKNLCTVSRAFYAAAKPYVWRRAQIRLPRSWLSLVSEITGGEDAVDESAMDLVEHALDVAARSVYALTAGAKEPDHSMPQLHPPITSTHSHSSLSQTRSLPCALPFVRSLRLLAMPPCPLSC